jgi:hypothetical protein
MRTADSIMASKIIDLQL